MKIENEPEVSTSTDITVGKRLNIRQLFTAQSLINLTTVDRVFQLKLKSVGICQQWYSEVSHYLYS